MQDNKTANLVAKYKPTVHEKLDGQWKDQEINWRRTRFVSLMREEEEEEEKKELEESNVWW
jgi:hypothetical protein